MHKSYDEKMRGKSEKKDDIKPDKKIKPLKEFNGNK